ncbi:DNA polymerase III subunit delta' [Ferriphaselus sp. R-1]|uniref:DNA polymerase III subunit delta' n=1 Tax=Ferriphaselus sp. R-1 TaxID=1485544 RepID=UPI000558F763|nr:DNA polymerase III subunit delta' [Ferriphaselus sp. R-1]
MNALYPWQQEDWQRLQALRQRLPHGLLLKGGQGIGKLDLALAFAASLLCVHPDDDGQACGKCASCHWFEQGSHPDFRLVQSEADAVGDAGEAIEGEKADKKKSKVIRIEQLRALEDFFNQSAHQGQRRVVVISPAESMPPAAANALLKTLEEPTPGLHFLLVTHKPQQLLPTILSRCLAFAVTLPPAETACRWLSEQGVTDAEAVLAQAGFAPLLALELATQEQGAGRAILLQALCAAPSVDYLALADKLQRTELPQVVHWLQQWCYDLSSVRSTGRVRYHGNHAAALRKLADRVAPLQLMNFQRDLLTARREASHPLNPRLFLESLFAAYQHCYA